MLISSALRFLWACRRSYAVSFLAFVVVLFAVAVPVTLMARVAWITFVHDVFGELRLSPALFHLTLTSGWVLLNSHRLWKTSPSG